MFFLYENTMQTDLLVIGNCYTSEFLSNVVASSRYISIQVWFLFRSLTSTASSYFLVCWRFEKYRPCRV